MEKIRALKENQNVDLNVIFIQKIILRFQSVAFAHFIIKRKYKHNGIKYISKSYIITICLALKLHQLCISPANHKIIKFTV
jgi:hypothetical protein